MKNWMKKVVMVVVFLFAASVLSGCYEEEGNTDNNISNPQEQGNETSFKALDDSPEQEPVAQSEVKPKISAKLENNMSNLNPNRFDNPLPNHCDEDDDCDGGYCNANHKCVQCLQGHKHCPQEFQCSADGICVFHLVCSPGVPFCIKDSSVLCDDSGQFVFLIRNCDDNNACTTGDTCLAGGVCGKGVEISCEDHNNCTDDWCDQTLGCVNMDNTLGCDDDDPCTLGDQCALDECISGTWDDACECAVDDDCIWLNSEDQCAARFACVQNRCIRNVTTTVQCGPSPSQCLGYLCNPDTGVCDLWPIEDLDDYGEPVACDDHDPCSVGDYCSGGSCISGAKEKCNDNNPCTADYCDPVSGVCTNEPLLGAACDDGNKCTENDVCKVTSPPSSYPYCSGTKKALPEFEHDCIECKCLPAIGDKCKVKDIPECSL